MKISYLLLINRLYRASAFTIAIICATVSSAVAEICPTFPEDAARFNLGSVLKWSTVDNSNSRDTGGVQTGEIPWPGSRYQSAQWKLPGGDIYLFGGAGRAGSATGVLNDFWKYDDSKSRWVYLGSTGDSIAEDNILTPGSEYPGSRQAAVSWIDNTGNLWLFGGARSVSAPGGYLKYLSDMWKYDVTLGKWEYKSGEAVTENTNGIYEGTDQRPGSREAAQGWVDNNGTFWLFGGNGYGEDGEAILNDLWKFDPATLKWEFVSGQLFGNGTGNSSNTAAPLHPGARIGSAGWTDANGDLWMFGGSGFTETFAYGTLNDMWKFSIASESWTFHGGTGTYVNQPGDYSQSSAYPASKYFAAAAKDSDGNFWLYGGLREIDRVSTSPPPQPYRDYGATTDFWKFNPDTKQWTLIYGDGELHKSPQHDSVDGRPGARLGAAAWFDSHGSFKLFGGYHINIIGDYYYNDFWTFRFQDGRPVLETTQNNLGELTLNLIDPDNVGILTVVQPAMKGLVSLKPDTKTTLQFSPHPNTLGEEEIIIGAEKTAGNDCELTTYPLVLRIVPVGNCPAGQDMTAEVDKNGSLQIDLGLMDNDTPVDNLIVTVIAQPNNGTVAVQPNRKILYTPQANFVGSDSFSYKVGDGTCDSVNYTISLTIKDTETSLIDNWAIY